MEVEVAIKDSNKRISIKLDKEDYKKIEGLAADEMRSVSNYLSYIIKIHLDKEEDNEK